MTAPADAPPLDPDLRRWLERSEAVDLFATRLAHARQAHARQNRVRRPDPG